MFCRKSKTKVKIANNATLSETVAISWKPILDTAPQWEDDDHKTDAAVKPEEPVPVVEISAVEHAPNDIIACSFVLPVVDSNENYVDADGAKAKKSDARSMDEYGRLSSASILSNNSGVSDTAMMARRKPLRTRDDEPAIELVTYEKTEKEIQSMRKALRADEFFTTIADDAVEQLIAYMSPRQVKSGEVIIRLGDKDGDCMYVSQAGKYQITTRDHNQIDFSNCRLFGEVAILCDTPRTASVTALTDGTLWTLKRSVFKQVVLKFKKKEDDALLEFLRKVPGINEASDVKLRRIADFCKPRTYAKDTPIVHEGQKGNDFFIIKSGSAVVHKIGVGKVKTYERGDFFGEKALLTEDKRAASVTAGSGGAVCLILSRGEFNENLGDLRVFLAESDEKAAPVEVRPQIARPSARNDRYQHITLKELRVVKPLGQGAFGIVQLVKSSKGELFALKSIERRRLQESKCEQLAYNERNIQTACECPFIVEMYRTKGLKDDTKLCFLQEYCPRGELFTVLRKKRKFPEVIAKFVAGCVLEALAYLHRRHYVYLDLKPENVIIDLDGYPKLTDFGCAQQLKRGEKIYTVMGTPEYLAPEIVRHLGYDKSADYWAYGILVYEMLFGATPFVPKGDQFDHKKLVHSITKGLTATHLQKFDKPTTRDFVRRLIEVNPNKRLGCLRNGADDLFQHDWFKDLDFVLLNQKRVRSPLLSLFKK